MSKAAVTREQWEALRYPIELKRLSDEEGGGWLAHIPLLGKGLFMVDADTAEEAIAELEQLRVSQYDTVISAGAPIPLPEDEAEKASGKWVQRTSPALHSELRRMASAQNISLNSLCESMLIRGLCAETAEAEMRRTANKILEDFELQITKQARRARYEFTMSLDASLPPSHISHPEDEYADFCTHAA